MAAPADASAVRALRSSLGWTQQRLAAELGTDHGTVSRWERGISRPRRSALQRLRLLGLDGRRRFARFPVGVAMVVVDAEARVLLLEDPGTGSLEIPSGAVEDGETILDAVHRELSEELGARCVLDPIETVHTYTIDYADEPLVSVVYLVAYDGGMIVPSDDVAGAAVRWAEPRVLDELHPRIVVPSEPWILERALERWTNSQESVNRGPSSERARSRGRGRR